MSALPLPRPRSHRPAAVSSRAPAQRSFRTGWRLAAPDLRETLAADWSRLMLAKFGSDEACAGAFGVTRQCAANWRSGEVCRPAGQHVARAFLLWPEDCRRILGRAA